MQNLKYKFRLYPTKEQEIRLIQIAGSNRYVWNHFLNKEQEQYQIDKKFRFYNKNSKDLTALKQAADTGWLSNTPSTSLQQTLRYLDSALKQSFKRNNAKKGFPKFKKHKNFSRSFSLAMVNARQNIKQNKFHVAKGLDVKVVMHRDIPSDFKTCQIKQEGDRWFVVLTCKKEISNLPKTYKSIGIDLNSKDFVLSNGIRFAIPKYLRESQAQVKHLQQELSRKVKGSSNRKKAQSKLSNVHQRIANKRLDYFHKLSYALVREYDLICLEDLDVKAIQQKMGHVVKDNGFGMFRTFIEYKAALYGKNTVVINRYFPSSQLCSQCGSVHKMDLSERVYVCQNLVCGAIMDRDLNAAINIKRAGTAPINAFGDAQLVDQVKLLGILADLNEEGSHVL